MQYSLHDPSASQQASVEGMQSQSFTTFERPAHVGQTSPDIRSPFDQRARGSTSSQSDSISYPEARINTFTTNPSSHLDPPMSPQGAAGKGSRFAKFFHERTAQAAAAGQAQAQATAGVGNLLSPQQLPPARGSADPAPTNNMNAKGGSAQNIQDVLSMLQNSQAQQVCIAVI
jgi:hypothetical protein